MSQTRIPIILALALALSAASAGAQTANRATITPTSKVWIDGTSNLHDWNCSTTKFTAAIDLDSAAASVATALPRLLQTVSVTIPVRSLTCDHSGMNDNTYKALKADKNPNITFVMASFDTAAGTAPGTFTVSAKGTLSIAGQSNAVTLVASGQRQPDGTLKVTATVPLKMTDYGISPPTAILGTLKVRNEINVKFDLTLGATTVPNQTPQQ